MDNRLEPTNRFSTKAERYARYRWGYAPEAIQAIFDITGLTSDAIVADIGAGTGLVAREFVGRVAKIYAVEPNQPMREIAERTLSQHPTFMGVSGRAEATTLVDHSIDLIVVGQALHWFEPQAVLKEFRRILKPEGWLAVFFHTPIDHTISEALKPYFTVEYGWDTTPSPKPQVGGSHTDYYFGIGNGIKMHFPQTWQESWDDFIGGILSDSHSPDDSHPAFQSFVSAVRQVYNQFCDGNSLKVIGGTDLVLGQLRKGVS
jgi:ubiquinone/menaquinone biosynthesis C-methylase UbiE